MKLQNSYIFLDKSVEQDKKTNSESLEFTKKVREYIKDIFPDVKKVRQDRILRLVEYSCEFEIGSQKCTATFIIKNVVKDTYMDIVVEGKTKANIIKCLENIYLLLIKNEIENDYIMIISYDSICEYYCNKIYQHFNELERNLRKLLFNIYVVNFGREYYKITTTDEFQEKIKKVIKASGNSEKKEIERLQKFFYSMTFFDIETLLFAKQWTSIEEENKNKLLRGNLTGLSEEELRKKIESIEPKSDWDRFFKEKIPDINVKEIIEYLREQRNNVAHCKFFYKDDYNQCQKYIKELNIVIERAIIITEEKDFKEKNKKYLEKSSESLSNALEIWAKKMVEICTPINKLQESVNAMLAPLNKFYSSVNQTIIPFENINESIIKSMRPLIDIPNPLANLSDTLMNLYNPLSNIQIPFDNLENIVEAYNTDENEEEKNNESKIETKDEEK